MHFCHHHSQAACVGSHQLCDCCRCFICTITDLLAPTRSVTKIQVKHLFRWMGTFPANRSAINKRLATGSVAFLPEGVAGIFQGANMCVFAVTTGKMMRPRGTAHMQSYVAAAIQHSLYTRDARGLRGIMGSIQYHRGAAGMSGSIHQRVACEFCRQTATRYTCAASEMAED